MDKPGRYKAKNKKPPPKTKNAKRKKSDGPTCSMFLSELSKKLVLKKRQEEDETATNIVHTIIDSITNALPFVFSRKTPEKKESPMKIENLQTFAPELLPNDTINVPGPVQVAPIPVQGEVLVNQIQTSPKKAFKVPKMPVVTSEVFKLANQRKVPTVDVAVNTGGDHDVASEIKRHVGTLKKISLIAEEFNQKTAKNLKEIVDSVQEDLIKKLEEIQAEQKMSKIEETVQVERCDSKLAGVAK